MEPITTPPWAMRPLVLVLLVATIFAAGRAEAQVAGPAVWRQPAPAPVVATRAPTVVSTEPNPRLWVPGVVLFAASYVINAAIVSPFAGASIGLNIAGSSSSFPGEWDAVRAWGLVPCLGPFVQAAVKPTDFLEDGWGVYLLLDGAIQILGVTLFVLGFTEPREVVGQASGPRVTLTVGAGRVGLEGAF